MPRTKGSKNKVNVQKQKQTQIVNVNINQEKKVTKRKPRAKKDSKPKTPIIYQYGEPVLGKPSDNLLYNSPPVIAQVIPQIGRESQAILPPKDTGVESILSQIKNKTERIVQSGKSKILSDTGSSEILNIEPKKKKGLSDTGATEILNIEPKVKELKDVGTQQTKPERKPMTDTGSTDIFNIEPKKKDIKDIGTEPTKRILSDTGNEIIFETQKQKEPKLLKFDKEKVSDVKTREMFRKQNKESIDKYKNMIPANDFQADKVFAQREQLPINPFPIYKEEQKRKVKQIIEKAPEPSSAMAEIMTRKIIVPKYSDISGNKERMEKQEERIKKQKEEGVRVTKRLSDIGDISSKQLYGSNSPLIIASQKSGNKNPVIETIKNKKNKASVSSFLEADKQAKLLSKDILGSALRDVNKEKKKDLKKESFKAILELDKLQNELLMKQAMEKRKKKDEIKLKEMELEKGKTIKAFNTIAGALKQKVARKKLNELKMDKVGNILHFKKEAAKSIFRDKLKSNTKRFGSKGYVVDVPKSETARLREAVKKEQRALKEKYTGVMKP